MTYNNEHKYYLSKPVCWRHLKSHFQIFQLLQTIIVVQLSSHLKKENKGKCLASNVSEQQNIKCSDAMFSSDDTKRVTTKLGNSEIHKSTSQFRSAVNQV